MKSRIKSITYIALGAVILSVCSWISLPTPLIPFTLQTFGIYFLVYFFGSKKALASLIVYIAMGLIGLPVFSSFRSGAAVLLSVSGGYIFGFVLSVSLYIAAEPFLTKKRYLRSFVSLLSLMACYAVGSMWMLLYIEAETEFFDIFFGSSCVFLGFDIVKLLLASALARYMKKIMP